MFLGEATLPDDERIYAIGDVHGRLDLLEMMLARIEADRAAKPVARSAVLFVGDYTDRGPQSREVLDRLCVLASDQSFIFLRGNHDQWLENFMDEPEASGDKFLYWGGMATLRSYGVDVEAGRTLKELSRDLVRRFPASHRRFLASLADCHIAGDYFFVHAGVRPGVQLDQQEQHDLLWIRDEFLSHPGSFGKVVVHGHTPRSTVELMPNRINVDTRAFQSGVLSCVVLEGQGHRLIQACAD
ncbi:MAG: metallophosphoesterase family protein [Rhizobiaceae bacterium]